MRYVSLIIYNFILKNTPLNTMMHIPYRNDNDNVFDSSVVLMWMGGWFTLGNK